MKKKLIRTSTIPTSLETLLKGQLKMLSKHYEVVAVSSPGEKMKVLEEREMVRTVSVPMERRISLVKDFISLIRLIILFAKEQPDIVHSITPKAGLLSMLAAWITRVPVRMHTFTGLVFPTTTGKMQKLLIAMDRLTCFCATHINPEGEGVKRDLINYKITSKPLHVIANGNVNGIDLEYFDRIPEVMEKAWLYKKEGTFTFCFVGRMVKDKGVNELVHSFLRLYQEDDQVRLLLVGPFETELDPVLPEVEEQILHHPGICFMGFQGDVRPFLAASDALVFPSYREGFPNVVIQAGAMGIPAIVTDINGCNEIVLPDRNGVIIPSKNEQALYEAMKYFASHSVEVEKMAANARTLIVSRYEQRMVWDALLAEYKSII
ncbi:glycosyltransferase family 4 protein [Parabacteroides faecis]|uniref:glycosyltransferase family 4 protein n=1 Tax=Parabacteroides TaxID=375288 RepID=UPI000F008984|nr:MULTISPECIES: glycosyltransferase family 4 protein [Parabacteroides]MBC8620196.1 glycosyltransferase family 4 protein [Parabacteroides faecis]RHS00963.1 glycosyltransferase family 1 protein [Parabacteroides sp. AF14-59]